MPPPRWLRCDPQRWLRRASATVPPPRWPCITRAPTMTNLNASLEAKSTELRNQYITFVIDADARSSDCTVRGEHHGSARFAVVVALSLTHFYLSLFIYSLFSLLSIFLSVSQPLSLYFLYLSPHPILFFPTPKNSILSFFCLSFSLSLSFAFSHSYLIF